MSFSLNKHILIGNLGNDSETRVSTNNIGITNFSVATTHSYKGKDGNWINETTWHNIVAFNVSDYIKGSLKKGSKVCVEGRISKRDYMDKDNIKRYVVETVADKIIPLSEKQNVEEQTSSEIQNNNKEDDDLPF